MDVADGAYGTLLQQHLHGDETVDDLCVRMPSVVVDAHRAYLEAGATTLQSNAFLAHLRGSRRRRDALQLAALRCVRDAVELTDGLDRASITVTATIGPVGSEPRDYWRDVELVLDDGVQAVQFETATSTHIARAMASAWQDVAAGVSDVAARIGCSITPEPGEAVHGGVLALADSLPDSIDLGLNCCAGPAGLRSTLERLCELRGSAWVMPSAGVPERTAGRTRWPFADPAEWATRVLEEIDGLPVTLVGGCCGTTPEHIAVLRGS